MAASYQSDSNSALRSSYMLRSTLQRFSLHKKLYSALTGGLVIAAGVPLYSFAFAGNTGNTDQRIDSRDSLSPTTSSSTVESSSMPDQQSSTKTRVTINGEDVILPQNGTVHKETLNEHGHTVVDINVQNSSSGNTVSSSSTVEVRSSSGSSSPTTTSEGP